MKLEEDVSESLAERDLKLDWDAVGESFDTDTVCDLTSAVGESVRVIDSVSDRVCVT